MSCRMLSSLPLTSRYFSRHLCHHVSFPRKHHGKEVLPVLATDIGLAHVRPGFCGKELEGHCHIRPSH